MNERWRWIAHQHQWGWAEVVEGPSMVGCRFEVCVICLHWRWELTHDEPFDAPES